MTLTHLNFFMGYALPIDLGESSNESVVCPGRHQVFRERCRGRAQTNCFAMQTPQRKATNQQKWHSMNDTHSVALLHGLRLADRPGGILERERRLPRTPPSVQNTMLPKDANNFFPIQIFQRKADNQHKWSSMIDAHSLELLHGLRLAN